MPSATSWPPALTFTNNGSATFSRDITGTGGIYLTGGFSNGLTFNGTSNSFEGPILLAGAGNGNYETRVTFASLTDSTTANGRIVFSTNNASRAAGSQFEYTGTTNLLLANRQIELASTLVSPTFGHQIRSSGSGTLSVSTDLIVSTPIAQTLNLDGANTGANTYSGKIVDGDGKVSLTKSEAGRWILSGANTYSGSTLISGGTLELGNSLALQNSALDATNSVTGGAAAGLKTTVTTLTIGGLNGTKNLKTLFTSALGGAGGTTTTGGYDGVTALTLNPGTGVTSTYSGAIVNGASGMTLTKTGAGTQVLQGTNTYTGATTVSQGALAVNGSLANTTTTVGNTGTLQGNGTIGGSVTIQSGGTLAPGNSIESLGTGALSFVSGSTYAYELQTNLYAGTPGVAGDLTFSTGTLDIQAGTILTLTDLAATTALANGSKLTLISYFGGWTSGELFSYDAGAGLTTLADNSTFILGANQWRFDYNDTTGGLNYTGDQSGATSFVTMTVVPEPGTTLIGSLGLLALMRRRRN